VTTFVAKAVYEISALRAGQIRDVPPREYSRLFADAHLLSATQVTVDRNGHWSIVLNGDHVILREESDYFPDPMEGSAKRFRGTARDEGLTEWQLRQAIDQWKAVNGEVAGRETTRATATPRLKWEKDRLPDEDAAHFVARAGYEHRGLIHDEDRALSVKLSNWLRTHDWPEGVRYVPTKPEWNDRGVERLPELLGTETVREVERLAAAARAPRRKALTPNT